MDEGRLAVLYTADLAGRLDMLPRLFTVIQGVRGRRGGPVTLLDLGGSCHPGHWECAATEGRAAQLEAGQPVLWLAKPSGDSLGILEATFDEARQPAVALAQVAEWPVEARPDATIAAAVDFVRDQARWYRQAQLKGDAHAAG